MNSISRSELLHHADGSDYADFYTYHLKCDNGSKDHTKRLWIKVEKGKIHGTCHNCGAKRTISTKKQYKFKEKLDNKRIFKGLPDDYTLEIPAENKVWLYKSRVYDDLIAKYRIGWSDSYKRVILPVFFNGECVLWQGRATLPEQNPKYLTSKKGAISWMHNRHCSNRLVIVEDMLSAIRVGEHSNSLGLLGTKMSDVLKDKILTTYKDISIWLDHDRAGVLGLLKIKKQLTVPNNNVNIIRTDLDPKCYSDHDIERILHEHKHTKHLSE